MTYANDILGPLGEQDLVPEEPRVVQARLLSDEDIAALHDPVREAVKPPERIKMRARHHSLAKLLVQGYTQRLAGAMLGYSDSTVSILMSDPAFQELLAHYTKNADEAFSRTFERLAEVTVDALEELNTRLAEEPEKISTGQLIEITKLGADRTGHGPSSQTNVNVNVGMADRMNRGRQRVLEARRSAGLIEDAETLE